MFSNNIFTNMKNKTFLSKLSTGILLILVLFCSCKNKSSEQKSEQSKTTVEAKSESVNFKGADGNISGVLQIPADVNISDCPIAIIMHGYSGNKEAALLKVMADKLQSQGIASLRFDFNGHGKSEGEFQDMTVPKEIIDAHKAYQYIRSLGFKGKVFMVGHSQGGVVAGMTSGELGSDSIAGLVLMAPAAVLKDDALKGNTMGVKYDPVNPPAYVEIYGKKLGRDYIKSAQTLPIYETTQQYNGPKIGRAHV